MDKSTKDRVKEAIEKIPDGDMTPLNGGQLQYRLRVGNMRVIFSYPDNNTLMIEKIGPRGDVYKGGLFR